MYRYIKNFVVSGLVVSPPLVSNYDVPFLFLSFSSQSVSTILLSSTILVCGFPAPQCWPVILYWCISVFFSFIMFSVLPMFSVLFCVSWIVTGNKTGISSDILGAYLDLCGTIISRLNSCTRSPLNKALLP